mgnify:FL=1
MFFVADDAFTSQINLVKHFRIVGVGLDDEINNNYCISRFIDIFYPNLIVYYYRNITFTLLQQAYIIGQWSCTLQSSRAKILTELSLKR